ncbi:carbon-phosphorus lyase subunit PhnH [Bradyrhizobium centrolobii]|uniref:Carbon-phosphorus lyase subunit PhnH n=2 Tax=Bradyrhizobium TaxID=374 RepID=A0A176ZG08_9BRAD|nr:MULTISPECIES: phosphonate C-P lyase system protein PhnH [Bradyrhizobium]OAF11879.1 carbon-phosphorus lyase subunit PhnH [Bradyrhizobium centrolobii]OAF19144.1 carbon-phosphorus lyase subunit PhnH [Bradyrhizobium neotropicale]
MSTIAEMPSGPGDKVLSAQSTFRSVMNAMARPASVQRIAALADAPAPMTPAMAAIALTLFDHDTPLWLDAQIAESPDVPRWLKFHTGAPVVHDCGMAAFALIADGGRLPALENFAFGSVDYPDRSTTVIVQAESLNAGCAYELRGPGIKGTATLQATIKPADLFEQLRINEVLFPRGIDTILVADDAVVAIPRTTRLITKGS